MAITAAKLMVEVDVDTSKAEQKTRSFGNALKGLATGMAMGAGMGLFNAIADGAQGAVAGMNNAVRAASDLSETINMMNVVMGQASAGVMAWSQDAAKALGMTQNQALTAAGTFAAFGKSAGMSGDELSTFSTDLVGLAADLGSFYNTSPEDAIMAIGAALRGEMEPIRRYNVLLDDMSLRQEAVRIGISKTTKDALTPQQKMLATNSLLWQRTADAQGDFERTSGGLAGQQKILIANMDALSVSVGEALLPAMTAFTTAGNELVTAVLPSLGSLLTTYVVPALSDIAEGVAAAGVNFGTFLDAVDMGADPVGAFVDAFDLEPIVEETNSVIVAMENMALQIQVAFNSALFSMNEFVGNAVREYNRMVWAMNDVGINALQPMRHSNWVGDPSGFQPTPLGLHTIPTSGFGGGDAQAAPGGYGYTAMQSQKALATAAKESGDALKGTYSPAVIAAAAASGGLATAADTAAKDLQSALSKIPGLFGTSSVTSQDMAKAAAGLPVNYADDYVRQAADELINGIDLANIDPAEVARSVGLDPSVPAQIIIDELTRQWETGEYFANPENLAKINWQAVKDAALKEANAVLGNQNLVAEAIAQGVTLESFKPLADDSVVKMAQSLTAATTAPENKAVLATAGAAAAEQYYWGWKGWMAEAPIVPPSGLPGGPPASPPGVPVAQGPGFPTITGANGVTLPLTIRDRNATVAGTGRGGVTINATVASDFDLEKMAVRVAQVIQSKRR